MNNSSDELLLEEVPEEDYEQLSQPVSEPGSEFDSETFSGPPTSEYIPSQDSESSCRSEDSQVVSTKITLKKSIRKIFFQTIKDVLKKSHSICSVNWW